MKSRGFAVNDLKGLALLAKRPVSLGEAIHFV
jgi:hypothetical protein